MGQSRIPPGFMYDRSAPREWGEQLHQLAPQSEMVPWLRLAWLSGDPWEPVQRWCVYEMVPLRIWWGIIQAHRSRGKRPEEIWEYEILRHLQGPDPRGMGHWDSVLGKYVTEAEVTRQEWQMHREFKAVPKLFWIIQGDQGGHKRHFSPIEQKYLKMLRLPEDPPAPGDLPYAEFDSRVLFQLQRRDRLHAAQGRLSTVTDEKHPDMVEFRRGLVGYLTDQVTAELESYKLNLDGIPRSHAREDDPTGHIEQAIENFINTGRMEPEGD